MCRSTYVLRLLIVLQFFFTGILLQDKAHHKSQKELVKELYLMGDIQNKRIREVIKQVDRRYYVDQKPYDEEDPQDLGYGATFATPQVHALALQSLKKYLVEGKKVLDVGCGTGYLTVCMAIMVGEKGCVVGIDHIPELIEKAKESIRKDNYTYMLEQNRIRLLEGDGRLGAPQFGPYDAIHVGAALEKGKIPKQLIRQLNNRGRMIITTHRFYEEVSYQDLMFVDKDEKGEIKIRNDTFEDCVLLETTYEFLTDKQIQLDNLAKKLKRKAALS